MPESPGNPNDKLPHPDCLHLDAAHGWLMLGLPMDALSELDQISHRCQHLLPTLDARYDALAACKRWDESLEIAEQILTQCPECPSGWVKQSYTLHELQRTGEARERLAEAEPNFPEEWLIPYNLACYSCQMGEESACIKWLEKAARRGEPKRILLIAMEDDDLKAVRSKLPSIFRVKS